MFRLRFTEISHAGSGCPGRGARRAMARAASLAAITVLTLGTLSGPAGAQVVRDHRTHSGGAGTGQPAAPTGGTGTAQPSAASNTTPLGAFFTKLTCNRESDDNTWPNPDHDEPYLVIFAADLRGGTAKGAVFGSQIFWDTDTGETKDTSLQFWPLNGSSGSPIGSEDDYIFLAQLRESDQSPGETTYQDTLTSLKLSLIPKLRAYKQAGMSRAAIASALRADMDLAFQVQDGDDQIGPVWEIFWGTEWLPMARSGQPVYRSAVLVGNGSSYSLEFQLRP
jgi:hypothetical protein